MIPGSTCSRVHKHIRDGFLLFAVQMSVVGNGLDTLVTADLLDMIRIDVEVGELLNQELPCRMVGESPVIGNAGRRHHATEHAVQGVLAQSVAFVTDDILTTPVDSQVERGIGVVHLSRSESPIPLVRLNRTP